MNDCKGACQASPHALLFKGGGDSVVPFLITMTSLSYLQRIEEDRQNQQYGWGIRKDNGKWEVYEWQRLSELSIHTQGLIAFDEEWQAEQYINNIVHG